MNLFLIGSGFTKSVFPGAPLNNELLGVLSRENPHGAAVTLADKYNTGDIEIALTKLDLEISSTTDEKDKLRGIRHEVEVELATHFHSYTASEELLDGKPWLRDFLENIVSEGDVAVSLNYDPVFEGLLDCAGKWSPMGGYGEHFPFPFDGDAAYTRSPVTVLKIHGSITFKAVPYYNKPHCNSVSFIFHEYFFPNSAKKKHFDYGLGSGEVYLIAPSYVKVPSVEMTYLMIDAFKATSEAKNLIVIGCGLRPEDTSLTYLLTNFLRQSDWQERRIIIIDPNVNAIAEKILHYWGVNVNQCILPIEKNFYNSIGDLRGQLE
jgi:hypothetical protein